MLNTPLMLFFEFFKVGLLTYGGGYGSLPFLYDIAEKYDWFTSTQLTQMIAISGITPGPIGLNMATFCGYNTFNMIGALIASFGVILPMIIITCQVFRLYRKFNENIFVKSVLYVLKPTSCGLISYVALKLFYELVMNKNLTTIDLKGLFILIILFLLTFKIPRNPIIYMVIAGLFGIGFYYFKF